MGKCRESMGKCWNPLESVERIKWKVLESTGNVGNPWESVGNARESIHGDLSMGIHGKVSRIHGKVLGIHMKVLGIQGKVLEIHG